MIHLKSTEGEQGQRESVQHTGQGEGECQPELSEWDFLKSLTLLVSRQRMKLG